MTTPGDPSEQPFHGVEYPPLEQSRPPDPYAPIDYPPTPPPPPFYPPPPPPPGYPGGYPGYSADPYDPYRGGRPMGTNGMAIGALVASLAGLFFCGVPSIVGLILGIVAMRETRRTGQEGHGMALAAVIVGALVLVGWIIYALIILAVAAYSPNIAT
jgi:Domain of unknown function (DUF4190)